MLFTSYECVRENKLHFYYNFSKALNIIKSLVISSTRNETGLSLGWVVLPAFLGGFTPQKTSGVFSGIYSGF